MNLANQSINGIRMLVKSISISHFGIFQKMEGKKQILIPLYMHYYTFLYFYTCSNI